MKRYLSLLELKRICSSVCERSTVAIGTSLASAYEDRYGERASLGTYREGVKGSVKVSDFGLAWMLTVIQHLSDLLIEEKKVAVLIDDVASMTRLACDVVEIMERHCPHSFFHGDESMYVTLAAKCKPGDTLSQEMLLDYYSVSVYNSISYWSPVVTSNANRSPLRILTALQRSGCIVRFDNKGYAPAGWREIRSALDDAVSYAEEG